MIFMACEKVVPVAITSSTISTGGVVIGGSVPSITLISGPGENKFVFSRRSSSLKPYCVGVSFRVSASVIIGARYCVARNSHSRVGRL